MQRPPGSADPAARFEAQLPSVALAAGVHVKVVSEQLGHSSVALTLDTASHVIPALEEDAVTRVAALLDGALAVGNSDHYRPP
jgi:hypothetical protein